MIYDPQQAKTFGRTQAYNIELELLILQIWGWKSASVANF